MAAYAALVSLMNILEQIQTHPRHSFSFDKKQMESLQEKVGSLQDLIEGYSHVGTKEQEVLESHIRSAAYAAEDVIESHVVDQIHAGSTLHGKKSSYFLVDLQTVIEDMDSIMKMAMKKKAIRGFGEQPPTYSKPVTSSRPLTTGKNAMVGFDDELILLMERLTGQQSNRQVIPIVGMGGIGKTTLARNVYKHLLIVQHFDIRAWVTVSQEYSLRQILLELLPREIDGTSATVDELGVQLHQRLFRRRYLIILDDMWSIEVWDKIKIFLPDDGNNSRVVLTTRLSNVADHCDSSCLRMNFLDEHKSWNLFCEKGFPQEGCPSELEEIGKKIVKKCGGLPLSIAVIGGHLGKSPRTQEYWENVAKDINSILNSGENEQCLNILSLSYNYLSAHLKPCFLYMGIFPEDYEIRVSQLIKLWVAEGFLQPNKAQSLEEVAKGYLKDLVDRSLIIVSRWSWNGKIKTCRIHDLLRELCLNVAAKEKFLCVLRVLDNPRTINRERRIVIHEIIPEVKHRPGIVFEHRPGIVFEYRPRVFDAIKSTSRARSLLLGRNVPWWLQLRLLRVLKAHGGDSLDATFKQVNLRYVAYELSMWNSERPSIWNSELPSSISLLWNLQTLIIRGASEPIFAPSEIWHVPQLRHLEIDEIYLPDPRSDRLDQQSDFVLQNLHTLLTVVNVRWSEEICNRIPNIKKLHIRFSKECEAISYYCLYNLGSLHKLKSLNCSFDKAPNRGDLLQNLTFPSLLHKLTLENCCLQWEDLTMIGSLPKLEVLKLGLHAFRGPEWSPIEGQFLRLKFLEIISIELNYWNAEGSHFPALENLVLRSMYRLSEIPSSIGDIPTLRVIELHYPSESAAISAMKIVEEQESLGNVDLQLQLTITHRDMQHIMKKEERKSFTNKNIIFSWGSMPVIAHRGGLILDGWYS